MKLLLLFFSLTIHKLTFSQVNIFGTYELKNSLADYRTFGAILILNCDYTYTVSDSIAKHWGTWKLKENETLILNIDSMAANGKIEKYSAKVYYKIINGQFSLAEREYSKKACRTDLAKINEAYKANNFPFRFYYSKENYEKWRKGKRCLYYEKRESFMCK